MVTHSADFLLVDVGNTSAKLRLANPTHLLGETRRFPTAELVADGGADVLRTALDGWEHCFAVLSSVVPTATRMVRTLLPDALTIHAGTDTGVDLRGYPGAETLGADRVANVAGALALHGPGPLIVVDFGTAATFNAVDAAGRFLGGVIAPGWRGVVDYLPSRTAQLPSIRLEGPPPRAIGRDTGEALRAGALLGYRGLVREILAGLRAELGGTARVVATGGDAPFLSGPEMLTFDVVSPDLTFHGLRVIAARLA